MQKEYCKYPVVVLSSVPVYDVEGVSAPSVPFDPPMLNHVPTTTQVPIPSAFSIREVISECSVCLILADNVSNVQILACNVDTSNFRVYVDNVVGRVQSQDNEYFYNKSSWETWTVPEDGVQDLLSAWASATIPIGQQ